VSPLRLAVIVGVATAPIVVATLAAPLAPGFHVVMWVVAVVAITSVVWRALVRPVSSVLDELAVTDLDSALWKTRELKDGAQQCRIQRTGMASLLEDLSSSLGEGLLVVTADLRIRLINPVALRFCGCDEVPENTDLLEILRAPDVVQAVKTAAAGDVPKRVITENPRGLWEVRAFPVSDGGAVMMISDVSLVRRSAEFRSRFVQDLSHELRSPLTVLRTSVEALEGELSDELAAVIVRQVERIDRLTNELYELATIESGHVELEIVPLRVTPAVQEVLVDFGPEAARARVEVRTALDGDLECLCDRRGLYRVLSNLVDNAIKYNRPRGWLEVRTRISSDRRLRLDVVDSGEGIPASELQAVLQRFYRVDRARTPGSGGLGLGLAIVKHMVQQMGGDLQLDSREGVGTTVTLLLPLPAGDGAADR